MPRGAALRTLAILGVIAALVATAAHAAPACVGRGTLTVAPLATTLGFRSARVADMDGDGLNDIVGTWQGGGPGRVGVLFGNGTVVPGGPFTFKDVVWVDVAAGGPIKLALADVTGDGAIDIVVGFDNDLSLQLYANNGDATFAPATTLVPGIDARSVVAADVNADGFPDIVFCATAPTIHVLFGSAAGLAPLPNNFTAVASVYACDVADVNGDGVLDLAGVGVGSSLLLGTGGGAFAAPVALVASPGSSSSFGFGDFDGDGDTDVAIMYFTPSNTLAININDGTGAYPSLVSYTPPSFSNNIDVVVTSGLAVITVLSPTYSHLVDYIAQAGDATVWTESALGGVSTVGVFGATSDTALVGLLGTNNLAWAPRTAPTTPGWSSLYSVGSGTSISVRVSDINRDGYADVLLKRFQIEILFNTGSFPTSLGSLQPVSTCGARAFDLGDVDSDGWTDIVISCSSSGLIWMSYNPDAAAFVEHIVDATFPSSLADASFWVVVADLTGDGVLDVAATHRGHTTPDIASLYTYVGTGGGAFVPAPVPSFALGGTGTTAYAMRAGDMDGDGDIDLAFSLDLTDLVWWANAGDATFVYSLPTANITAQTPAFSMPSAFALGSFLAPPALDAIVATPNTELYLFPNTGGSGSFGTGILVASGGSAVQALTTGFVDADNLLDILVVRNSVPSWFRSNGGGAFTEVTFTGPMYSPASDIAWADIDGDGERDFVISASGLKVHLGDRSSPIAPLAPSTRTPTPRLRCPNPAASIACMADDIAALSHCVRDTLALPTATYACAGSRHLAIGHAVRIAAAPGATPTFDCAVTGSPVGGALFRATTGLGGAVGDLELANVTVVNLGIGRASAVGAPGLRADVPGARLTLSRTTIASCASAPVGAAVAIPDIGKGGAVLASAGGRVELAASHVSACSASVAGGAAAADGDGSLLVISGGTVLTANTAPIGGALAATLGGAAAVTDASVTNNAAEGIGGGGIYVGPDSSISLAVTHITANTARFGFGGGMLLRPGGPNSTLTAAVFSANVALLGGGLAVTPLAFDAATFADGVTDVPMAASPTGAASGFPASSHVAMAGTTLTANTGLAYGGGLAVCAAEIRVSGTTDWSANTGLRAGSLPSGADAFLCAPNPADTGGLAWSRAAPGLPWLRTAGSELDDAHIAGPIAALEWLVGPPTADVVAGSGPSGRVAARDILGQVVTYARVPLRLAIAASSSGGAVTVAPIVDETVSLASIPLPTSAIAVVNTAAPAPQISATVSVGASPVSDGLPVPPLAFSFGIAPCPAGSGGVVASDGSTTCATCPGGTVSDAVGYAPCVPRPSCPPNTVRPAAVGNATSEPCVCAPGAWVASGAPDVACALCPTGGVCAGGSAQPVAGPGFYPVDGERPIFIACPTSEACLGGAVCRPGYQSRLCAECADDYYAIRGKCRKCERGRAVGVAVAMALGALAVMTLLLAFNLAENIRYKFGAAMIGLNALQISAIYGQLELDWGDIAAAYFDIASGLNLNIELTSPECSLGRSTDVWVLRWALTLCLPLFAAAGIALVGACALAVAATGRGWLGQKRPAEIMSACGRAWFQLLVLLYLPLTSAAFAAFGCRKDESGRWVLDADPSRSCYTAAWWAGLFPVGLLAVGAYALAIPVGMVSGLRAKKRTLDPIAFVLRFGFVVGRFRDSEWWFEAAIMVRKLLVVVCMTFFFTVEGKANAAVLVLVTSLIQLVASRPYRSLVLNGVGALMLAAVTLVLFAGTFDETTPRRLGVIGGIVVICLGAVGGVLLDIWTITRAEAAAENDEFYDGGLVKAEYALDTTTAIAMSDVGVSDSPPTSFTTVGLGAHSADIDTLVVDDDKLASNNVFV